MNGFSLNEWKWSHIAVEDDGKYPISTEQEHKF